MMRQATIVGTATFLALAAATARAAGDAARDDYLALARKLSVQPVFIEDERTLANDEQARLSLRTQRLQAAQTPVQVTSTDAGLAALARDVNRDYAAIGPTQVLVHTNRPADGAAEVEALSLGIAQAQQSAAEKKLTQVQQAAWAKLWPYAEKFAGPETRAPALAIKNVDLPDAAGTGAHPLKMHQLQVTNVTHKTLHHAAVQLRVTDVWGVTDGETFYLDEWPAGKTIGFYKYTSDMTVLSAAAALACDELHQKPAPTDIHPLSPAAKTAQDRLLAAFARGKTYSGFMVHLGRGKTTQTLTVQAFAAAGELNAGPHATVRLGSQTSAWQFAPILDDAGEVTGFEARQGRVHWTLTADGGLHGVSNGPAAQQARFGAEEEYTLAPGAAAPAAPAAADRPAAPVPTGPRVGALKTGVNVPGRRGQ